MRADAVLLLCAASAASAAARRGLPNRRSQQFYPSSNNTLSAQRAPPQLGTAAPPLASGTDSALSSASTASGVLGVETSSHGPVGGDASSMVASASTTQYLTWASPSYSSGNEASALLPANPTIPSSSLSSGPVVTVIVGCPAGINASNCTAPPGRGGNMSGNYSRISPTSDKCTSLTDKGKPMTQFSVVYTSTVTFFGNRSDYTPPFEPLATPNYCAFPALPPFGSAETASDALVASTTASTTTRRRKDLHANRPAITFITTDKNPAVVFPSDPVPRYSPTWISDGPGGRGSGHHQPAAGDRVPAGGSPSHPTPDVKTTGNVERPGFTVTARGHEVIINDHTYSDLTPSTSSVVVVDGGTFTIYPTAVVGEGATVQKPAPVGTALSVATPTTGVVGGLPVTLAGSEAVVGGTTMAIAPGGITTVVKGQSVSVGPGALAVGGHILSFQPAMPSAETDILVTGGELLTAIGRSVVVVHSTTFTYGPGIPEVTDVVDGDTIAIGPSGVLVHGMAIGGPRLGPARTTYEIVGGATITRIAPSIAVINGVTYTVGPGTHWTTEVIGGHTVTIGPSGVVLSTLTLEYPFGSAATTTIVATRTRVTFPVETTAESDGEESQGSFLRPGVFVWRIALCIAAGVGVLA